MAAEGQLSALLMAPPCIRLPLRTLAEPGFGSPPPRPPLSGGMPSALFGERPITAEGPSTISRCSRRCW
eukprot:scaffold13584_cov30-Tisochrysis_lutea.AAC.3